MDLKDVRETNHRYMFQVNTRFGRKRMSAAGSLGIVTSSSIQHLLKKIMKEFNLRIEQIILEFQPIGD